MLISDFLPVARCCATFAVLLIALTPGRARCEGCVDERIAVNGVIREKNREVLAQLTKNLADCKVKDTTLSNLEIIEIDGVLVTAYRRMVFLVEQELAAVRDAAARRDSPSMPPTRNDEAAGVVVEKLREDLDDAENELKRLKLLEEAINWKPRYHIPLRIRSGFRWMDLEDLGVGEKGNDHSGAFMRLETGFGGSVAPSLRVMGILSVDITQGSLRVIDDMQMRPAVTRRTVWAAGVDLSYVFGKAEWFGISIDIDIGVVNYRDIDPGGGTEVSYLYPTPRGSLSGGVGLDLLRRTVNFGFGGWRDRSLRGPNGYHLYIGFDVVMMARWLCSLKRCNSWR